MEKYKGFTLIELLVVIAIIGILSAVVLASLTPPARKVMMRLSNRTLIPLKHRRKFTTEAPVPIATVRKRLRQVLVTPVGQGSSPMQLSRKRFRELLLRAEVPQVMSHVMLQAHHMQSV